MKHPQIAWGAVDNHFQAERKGKGALILEHEHGGGRPRL